MTMQEVMRDEVHYDGVRPKKNVTQKMQSNGGEPPAQRVNESHQYLNEPRVGRGAADTNQRCY